MDSSENDAIKQMQLKMEICKSWAFFIDKECNQTHPGDYEY